jgi:hypothetical protein
MPGMIGTLFGGLVSDEDEDASRERRERARAGELLPMRKQLEVELRHARLRQLSTEVMQEAETTPEGRAAALARFPIPLPRDDLIAARVQVDRQMPLEFVMPEYVGDDESAAIDAEGMLVDRPAAPPAEADDATGDATDEDEATDDVEAPAATVGTGDEAATAPVPTETPTGAPTEDVTPDAGDTGAGGLGAGARTGVALLAGRADSGSAGRTGADAAEGETDEDGAARPDTAAASDDDVITTPLGELISTSSEIDLDELGRRLYERVRRELRHELLVDRERAGVLADVR